MATMALTRSVSPHPVPPRGRDPVNPINTTTTTNNITNTITNTNTTSTACPIPIPNKHLPLCPPGPAPADQPDTPPQSPPVPCPGLRRQPSLLDPPDRYPSRAVGAATIYEIDADGAAAALDQVAGQPLPDPSQVFPWLHGLHPSNLIQQAFFLARRKNLRQTPQGVRGLTIVKAGGDLSCARLKGAVAPDEFLRRDAQGARFKDVDPREGFSVRNFQIQAAKAAMLSDILVYGDDAPEVDRLAQDVAAAQRAWRETHLEKGHDVGSYHTFVCTSPFQAFEERHPDLVSSDAHGRLTGRVLDFFYQERLEMCTMTQASEIHHNVWLGPTPDPALGARLRGTHEPFDVLIECSDLGRLDPAALQALAERGAADPGPSYFDFPSSGSIMPPTWSPGEVDGILDTCKWVYALAHGGLPPAPASEVDAEVDAEVNAEVDAEVDADGDTPMPPSAPPTPMRERKILIHCPDGYTESTLLGLAYFTYATGLPIPAAWLDLHVRKRRNFFAYPSDVLLLTTIAPRLLSDSPANREKSPAEIADLAQEAPDWLRHMDGSLPSRITDYMYLGNLAHANNPALLRQMGIHQILSVGETATWSEGEAAHWGEDSVMVVQGVQDNGVDPLTGEFERCLQFIGPRPPPAWPCACAC